MVRVCDTAAFGFSCSPHTRGDGPHTQVSSRLEYWFSPHAWGWSEPGRRADADDGVLPTRVGMVRLLCATTIQGQSSPHTRGDGPTSCPLAHYSTQFSPHAWGWSEFDGGGHLWVGVLPTRVGMVRSHVAWHVGENCSPHTRGDGPSLATGESRIVKFSPHAWGWSAYQVGR